jgi:hypothetical protein
MRKTACPVVWKGCGVQLPSAPSNPCHSQDWFLRLKTSKYQQLMHDLFDFETWDFYRFFTNTPMETSDPASIREMSEAANNFGSPAE